MSDEVVYLGVGTNLGDRKGNISIATAEVSTYFRDFRKSSIYETEPMYREDQPKFLNCVFSGIGLIGPFELLEIIHGIENSIGRDRKSAGWMGPRPIDLDILLFGQRIIDTGELTVPHPRMKERPFVLIPLLELDPLVREPGTGIRYSDFASDLPRDGIYYHND